MVVRRTRVMVDEFVEGGAGREGRSPKQQDHQETSEG